MIKEFLLNLLFPRKCVNCLHKGYIVCPECLRTITFLKQFENGLVSCVDYKKSEVVRKMIISFKYKFDEDISLILSKILKTQFVYLSQYNSEFKNAIFVPVPLHNKRLMYRGFNQSLILAQNLLEDLKNDPELENYFANIEIANCLKRIVYRKPQAELGQFARLENIKNTIIFDGNFRELIYGRFVFVIDDVATTRATLDECSHILLSAGALGVCGFVLARA